MLPSIPVGVALLGFGRYRWRHRDGAEQGKVTLVLPSMPLSVALLEFGRYRWRSCGTGSLSRFARLAIARSLRSLTCEFIYRFFLGPSSL